MPDEDRRFSHLTAPPQRGSELEFLIEQLVRIPTRRELARYTFAILFVGAVTVFTLLLVIALWWWFATDESGNLKI